MNGGGFYTRKLQNLKDRICSFENLLAAYREAEKDKRYRNEVIVFRFNLEENLLSIQKELLEGTYKVGNYREFYVHYPKARLVMALGFRDRIVQWAIYRQINPEPSSTIQTFHLDFQKGHPFRIVREKSAYLMSACR